MTYETFTGKQEVTAVDIQTMASMTMTDYKEYLRNGLLYVDHHDVLRSEPAGYPLATSKAQLKALLAYIKELEPKIGSSE
ncbi:hypothetical protein [Janthinobacterium sp. SUN120]|uniref:hypothetical protein n=1 Tax=Janthinobacterium sp. SUN120 TaxID=3004099 RepID=UPI0025B107CD|nr:hypothetical protein [Janthinobacterium sp. SUN120]MDN2713694.1 hypothetical protein [Janthinobacterium sp. SUN120]